MTLDTITYDDSGSNTKNVMSQFMNMETDQIREALDSGRMPLVNICMNLSSDFNKSSVIRANNAFLGERVILVGGRRYDRRGTVGMHHYEWIQHSETLEPVIESLHSEGYTVYAVDNILEYDPKVLYDVEFPEKSAFLYGEEQAGLSKEAIDLCDGMVYIPQRGAVRSINIAQAAAVIMSEYTRQHRFDLS